VTIQEKTIQEKSLELGTLTWFYRESTPINPTTKPPVLLLHGLLSQSYGWRNIMPALSDQGFRSIAPDWIGFGSSSKPDRRQFDYTPDTYLTALEAFLQALKLEKFSLVVQGYLGSMGLQYALRHPEQIDRLMILNAPIALEAKLPWKIKQFGLPMIGEVLTQDPLLVDRTLEGGGGYQVKDADLDIYRRPFLKSSEAGRSLQAVVKNMQLPQVTAELAGFSQWQHPTLVAWGTRDPWLPLSLAQSFTATLKDGELVELEETGHYPQEDWHEKVSESLLPFLRRQS
jgi:pimeloyl-ACP methyl ester carboxylesterase